MPTRILGLATALPPASVAQSDALEMAIPFTRATPEEERTLRVLYRRSGVKRRSSVLLESGGEAPSFFPPPVSAGDRGPSTSMRMARYEREVGPLALAAAAAALADAGLAPCDVGQLVTVSCTGFFAPNFDVEVIKGLGLPASTGRTHVGFMGCQGALNGLRVADALARRDDGRAVLLVAAELCSLHYQYGFDPDQTVANALFADGAAAAVVGFREEGSGWRIAANGAWLLPECEDAMTWRIGDHGFLMTLSARVPDLIATHLRPALTAWLDQHSLTLEDIRTWAIHPGGPRILSAASEALGLPAEATNVSREVLAECGNMSSPTILFILHRLRRAAAPLPGVALAFGPGLSAEAALFL